MFRKSVIIFILCCCFVCISCEDQDTVINNYTTENAIIGRIVPAAGNITVELWQSNLIVSNKTDDSGYFSFVDLDPGMYEIIFYDSTTHRNIKNIEVKSGETTALGELQFANIPWPIMRILPLDNTTDVNALQSIKISSYKEIDLNSLETCFTINPVAVGGWRLKDQHFVSGEYIYEFSYNYYSSSSFLELNVEEEYTLTLSEDLQFEDGTKLGEDITVSFTTEKFKIVDYNLYTSYGFIELSDSVRIVELYLNSTYNPNEMVNAISFDPPLNFYLDNYSGSSRSVTILSQDELEINTSYVCTIDTTCVDITGKYLETSLSINFQTEDFKIEDYGLFPDYYSNTFIKLYPPDFDYDFTLLVNSIVDADMFNTAASFTPPIAGSWYQYKYNTYSSDYHLVFQPDSLFRTVPGQTYKLTINNTSPIIDNYYLDEPYICSVTTDLVRLLTIDPQFSDNYFDPYDDIRLYFNTAMDLDSLQDAVSLIKVGDTVKIPCTFGYYYYGNSNIVYMDPTINLEYGQIYEITIDTTAVSVSGYHLSEAVVARVRVRDM